MNHKILLGAAIALASIQASAIPFAPTDARSMAMGGTGVSSSTMASTIQFNPALLANTREDDHFGLKFPQMGGSVSDENDFVSEVEDFEKEDGFGKTNIDYLSDTLDIASDPISGLPGVADAATEVGRISADLAANPGTSSESSTTLQTANSSLTGKIAGLRSTVISSVGATTPDSDLVIYSGLIANDLDDLNNKALRVNGGLNIAAAIPSKKFSLAVGLTGQGVFSGKIIVPQQDTDQLRNYTSATDAYLTSAIAVTSATNDLVIAQQTLEGSPSQTNIDAVVAAASNLDAAQQALTGFNYGGDSTPAEDGDVVIFQNGELASSDVALDSQVHMIGAAIADINLSASRIFNIAGKDVAIGITPKLQMVTVFDYKFELDGKDELGNDVEFNEDDLTENTKEYSTFNMDIGAAYQFGAEKQFQAGLVIKNLMAKDFESANGETISIAPMVRAGVSHQTSWTKVAVDLDLTENHPVAFESASQYLSVGAEFDVWRILQLRAGYRANLAASDQDVVTAGIGFSPFAIHMDLGLMANASDPEKEAGIAFEFGVEF